VADELVVATVLAAEQQPGARAPALRLTLDLGTYGTEEAVMAGEGYDAERLVGTQLVCRRDPDGAIVVGAHSHAKGTVLLRPEDEVEPGSLVD
jgi:tRNA-binding EMAP/Myf-like protein